MVKKNYVDDPYSFWAKTFENPSMIRYRLIECPLYKAD